MGKIRELDGLRGLLAVWVVVVHLLPTAGFSARDFGTFAPLFGEHLRVEIFSILSGFVIFLMIRRRQEGYLAFLAGRLLRLYPAYLLAFGLSVLLAPMMLEAVTSAPFGGARMADRAVILQNSLDQPGAHILAHLTLLHGLVPQTWLPSAPYAFLGQAWNISTEFQFYLVAPVLFAGLTTGPLWRRAVAVAVCGAIWLGVRRFPNPASLAAYAPYFALGIVSFGLWRHDWGRARRWLTPLTVAAAAMTWAMAVDMASGIWLFVLGGMVLVRDQGRGGRGLSWLACPAMQGLGRLSYSLYLLHMLPMYLGMYLLNGQGLGQGAYLALLALFTFALGLPMAWLSSVYVEQGAHRLTVQRPRSDADISAPRQAL